MRVLVTIPHFFDPEGTGRHGSLRPDPVPRVRALAACLNALGQLSGESQRILDHAARRVLPVQPIPAARIDIIVCTTRGRHLLDHLPASRHAYEHHPTRAEPPLLGFECQSALRERLGAYDYYCYLEDDLIIRDPWFFAKLGWFAELAGGESVLQPNRFEAAPGGAVRKVYIDGDLHPHVTAPFQDIQEAPELTGTVLGTPVSFRRPLNPHAGCYFLNAEQMAHWARQPYFGERDTRFVGPLESAATLGIMRVFRVYKPAPASASFLEVQHYGTAYLGLIGRGPRHGHKRPAEPIAAPQQQEAAKGASAGPRTTPPGADGRPHVLFVHQNFPAQFGHIASHLARAKGFRCTFVSRQPPGHADGVERVQYRLRSGATAKTHYCGRTFENALWHAHGVYEALAARPDLRPDLIVGHSGFGPTLFLRELYDVPVINYFEYFYRPVDSDMDFRPEFPSAERDRLRARARNAMFLLDLENCDAGYSPTHWQRDRLPSLFHDKVRVIFDGIDIDLWRPRPGIPRRVGGSPVPDDVRIVTYVSRGFESMRGFDIFMRAARRLCDRRKDVLFVVVGEDRCFYSGDERITGGRSFKEWVLSRDDYDLSRFVFPGRLPPEELACLLAVSDLHVYLTVPFVLSWSLMNALACGATVLASRTGPVCEMIEHGRNGLLADFFDVEGLADLASRVLDAPRDFRHLGRVAAEMVQSGYSLEVCVPRMLQLYEDTLQSSLV